MLKSFFFKILYYNGKVSKLLVLQKFSEAEIRWILYVGLFSGLDLKY